MTETTADQEKPVYENVILTWFSYKGRVRRRTFWPCYILGLVVISIITYMVQTLLAKHFMPTSGSIRERAWMLTLLLYVPVIIVAILFISPLCIKRLHDSGHGSFLYWICTGLGTIDGALTYFSKIYSAFARQIGNSNAVGEAFNIEIKMSSFEIVIIPIGIIMVIRFLSSPDKYRNKYDYVHESGIMGHRLGARCPSLSLRIILTIGFTIITALLAEATCFDRWNVWNTLECGAMAVLIFILGYVLAPKIVAILARARDSYNHDDPVKAMAYSVIWVISSLLWSLVIITPSYITTQTLGNTYRWKSELVRHDMPTLLCWILLIAAPFVAQFIVTRIICCNTQKHVHCIDAESDAESIVYSPQSRSEHIIDIQGRENASSISTDNKQNMPVLVPTPNTESDTAEKNSIRKASFILFAFFTSLLCLVYWFFSSSRTRPHPHSSVSANGLLILPDVDVTPGYIEEPTEEERKVGTILAAYALRAEGEKYASIYDNARYPYKPVNFSDKKMQYRQIGEIYESVYGKYEKLEFLSSVFAELPESLKTQYHRKFLLTRNETRKTPLLSFESQTLLGEMLYQLAFYRFKHPEEPHIKVQKPKIFRSSSELSAELKLALSTSDIRKLEDVLSYDVDIRSQRIGEDYYGSPAMTPLQWCISKGKLDMAECILDHGADINEGTDTFPTLWHVMLYSEQDEAQVKQIARFLLKHRINPNTDIECPLTEEMKQLAESQAIKKVWNSLPNVPGDAEWKEQAKKIYGERAHALLPDKINQQPLHLFCALGDVGVVTMLLDAGACINNLPYIGSPLYIACKKNFVEIVRLLLSRGADVNAQTTGGWTPLMRSIYQKNSEIARILIEHGADLDIKSKYGNNAAWFAVYTGNKEILDLLIKHGISLSDATSDTNGSLLRTAIVNNDIVCIEMLLNAGVSLDRMDSRGISDGLILYKFCCLNPQYINIMTPNQIKIYKKELEMLKKERNGSP